MLAVRVGRNSVSERAEARGPGAAERGGDVGEEVEGALQACGRGGGMRGCSLKGDFEE